MPIIEISEGDFRRMQRLAEPLVDTPTTLVTKLLDVYEVSQKQSKLVGNTKRESENIFSFDAPPPLVHVKFLSGVIGTHSPERATWDSMVALCLKLVRQSISDIGTLNATIDLNVVKGKKVDEGYKFLPELDLSYQGVSAQHAASVIGKTARFLREGAFVDFVWREKDGAYAPGKYGALSYDLS